MYPSLKDVLYQLAMNGLNVTCTVTKYLKIDVELEAQEATIVVETPALASNEMMTIDRLRASLKAV